MVWRRLLFPPRKNIVSVKFRDYYETLGVERDAGADEIRKAYRKLARKYHPDVAEDKTAGEEKFKELNEAYEVLSDPEKRKKYDALGKNWRHMGDFTPPPGAGGGEFRDFGDGEGYAFHFEGTGFSDFFENLFGGRPHGAGFGGMPGFKGQGRHGGAARMRGGDIEADILVTLEESMNGAERTIVLQRPGTSNGRRIKVRIPKGIAEGQLIRCVGMGQPGINGGDPGDLFLRVLLERHPDFRVQGADLHCELPLAPWEAVLGGTVEIATLHGAVRVTVPPGTEAGTEFRFRGRGLPKGTGNQLGDLYAEVVLRTPARVSGEEEECWKRLREVSKFNPRK